METIETRRVTIYKHQTKVYMRIGGYMYGIRRANDGQLIDTITVGYIGSTRGANIGWINMPARLHNKVLDTVIDFVDKKKLDYEKIFIQQVLEPADKALLYYGLSFKELA